MSKTDTNSSLKYDKKPIPPKLPKTLGACADLLYKTQHERYEVQKRHVKELEKLKTLEAALEERIIEELPKSEASGVAGKSARVQVVNKPIPVVEDWDKFYEYIKKQKGIVGFSLLNRALNRKSVIEIREAGKDVPGVGNFIDVSVSCTKV